MRITKRFKSCEGTLNKSYLKNNFNEKNILVQKLRCNVYET